MGKGAATLSQPLLLLVGNHDLELAQNAAVAWHQAQANTKFHTIPDAGHCANMDNSATFNNLLAAFINKV